MITKFTKSFILMGFLLGSSLTSIQAKNTSKPNLLIIHTDEHNFRTLGCYRKLMTADQAYVWGEGVKVETPNIDALAQKGAICTNFYSSSPVCTPSRASFVSGLYPIATDSYANDIPMNDKVITFAQILSQQSYATSYVGKWHLDGDAKPGFSPNRKFGFADNKYMFNRGHWKLLDEEDGIPDIMGKFNSETNKVKENHSLMNEENFTTDFLTNRTLEILERDKDKPFCIMLAIPDPHGPNIVRAPYDTMFDDVHFNNPRTMNVPTESLPKWLNTSDAVSDLNQKQMQLYFGMVKCIDDNVGRLLNYLKENNLDKNTIIIFTSDHGDLMGEHKKHNKGNPYEGSARIPFIIKYPGKIKAGKVIQKAFTTVDFTPTILGLMDVPQIPNSQGLNASSDFLSKTKKVIDERITYITSSGSQWVAAVNNRYKLILSQKDEPWLYDLVKDPDELTNYYTNPKYASIAKTMKEELLSQLKTFNDPALHKNLKYE